MARAQVLSQQLLRRDPRTVPYPALAENTLVLSSCAVVGTRDSPDGALALMVRWVRRISRAALLHQLFLHSNMRIGCCD